jgi:hypothetical protein
VVVVHGNSRNVDGYFTYVTTGQPPPPADTVVVAPYFQASTDNPQPNDLYWTSSSWKDGEDAVDEATSSFAALDALLLALRQSFPNLMRVTFTGFSAGGQLVQRYAAASAQADQAGVQLRFAVGDPSSYMYLDQMRLIPGQTCSDRDHCPLTAASFQAPYANASSCPTYNDYKYGLMGSLPPYMASMTAAQIQARYTGRDVTYLVAALDNGPTSTADYSALDTGCEADAQGPIVSATDPSGQVVYHSYRMQRALTYWHYMTDMFHALHKMQWVPSCGHSAGCVYADAGARSVLFAP